MKNAAQPTIRKNNKTGDNLGKYKSFSNPSRL